MKAKTTRWMTGGLAATVFFTAQAPVIVSYASVTTEMTAFRTNVIKLCNIMDTSVDTSSVVTRGQFAEFLVKASSYKDSVSKSSIAAANDVPSSNEYAPYIRIALQQGWMRTYLGGQFRPDEPVKMQDAAKAIMALLGYSDSDFTGDIAASRLSAFNALELNEQLGSKSLTDQLTRLDCINIFYNLLKTNSKSSNSIYGTLFELSLASDGEIDPNDLVESNMEGPILVKTLTELANALPFDCQTANLYFNGYSTQYRAIESAIRLNGWLVIYYNEGNQTVWAYGEDYGDSQYHVVKGNITKIYYEANNIVSPSSIVLDDNTTYQLGNSEVKFMLGINGDIKLGDDVVVICDETEDEDGNETYSVVGVIKYIRNTDGSTVGTSNVIYAGSSSGTYVVGGDDSSQTSDTTDTASGTDTSASNQ